MSFFGIDVFLNKKKDLINAIFEDIDSNKKRAYYAINPDCMLRAKDDRTYYNILKDKNNQVYIDGQWIINTQKILNLPVAVERIATTDLFPEMLNMADKYNRKVKIFLLGGTEGTAERVIKNMKNVYKEVDFVGSHHGYFDKMLNSEVIEYINECNPEILFVGFGCPIQEKWVNENIDKINANIFITCGGLFDYYAENVKRAPRWMQKNGLEWLFRFIQEPKRLFKRYVFGNIRYLSSIFYIKLRGRKYYLKIIN